MRKSGRESRRAKQVGAPRRGLLGAANLCAAVALALSVGNTANVFAQRAAARQQRQRPAATVFTNPVMAGDFPDPSVIRVGSDYWATATTSEWAPEFPLLHSRDLVNWRVVGAIFQRRPAWSVGSYWAPELAQYRGQIYAYYVARKKNGPLCVAVATAPKPQGPYTDHGPLICQEVGSIDGFPVNDEQGRRYLLWKEDSNSVAKPTVIWAQPLSRDGLRLEGERRELIRNDQAWEKHPKHSFGDLVEGPALVRRNGYFYMFYSGNFCCDRECAYALGVARSRNLLGPWEKYEKNPILQGNEKWKCPGHGTVVEDPRGRHFLLYHAYHPEDFVYVGRQAMLDEVKWGPDGWPTINEGRGPSAEARSPLARRELNAEYSFFDDFTAARLRPEWQWPQDNEPVITVATARQGWLTLSPNPAHFESPVGAVLARPTTNGDYEATTLVETRALTGGASAGLAAYGDADNAIGLSVGGGRLRLWRRQRVNDKNESREVESTDAPAGAASLHLRMRARDGRYYRFAVSRDGREWRDVGEEVDGDYLPRWDRGVRVALVAGGARDAAGRFAFLRVAPRAE